MRSGDTGHTLPGIGKGETNHGFLPVRNLCVDLSLTRIVLRALPRYDQGPTKEYIPLEASRAWVFT